MTRSRVTRSSRVSPVAIRMLRLAAFAIACAEPMIVSSALAEETPARQPTLLVIQNEYIEDSNGNTYHDPSVFVAHGQSHLQVWLGQFTKGFELGHYFRDTRRSTYDVLYRFRDGFDHAIDLSTGQVLSRGFTGVATLRFIRVIPSDAEDRNLIQPSLGFDKYYGDYHFAGFRAVQDPTQRDRFTFVLLNRFAGHDRHVSFGIAPRTDGEVGYMVDTRLKWFRAGFGRFNRFDYTALDRTTFTVGVEARF